jgi:hypothetical protein
LPVHPNLIEPGLVKLVELRKRQGQHRLFPNLGRGTTRGNFTELFTRAFGCYRKTNNLYRLGLDSHALRTSFHGDRLNSHCSDAVPQRLMGHTPLDEGEESYAQNLSVGALLEGLLHVKVDISMMKSTCAEAPGFGIHMRTADLGLRLVS